MFVYLDYWSLIPMLVLWVVNLVMFGAARINKVTPVQTYPVMKYQEGCRERDQESDNQEISPSIFLNSATAIFFPTCHLHLPHISRKDQLGKVSTSVLREHG